MTKTERAVFLFLSECKEYVYPAASVATHLDLTIVSARRALRGLVRKKLAEVSCCYCDDGMLNGSGYVITDIGAKEIK